MPEIIYVFTNESMPGLVKIGRTTDSVEARIRDLSSPSGVPFSFECHFAAEVENCTTLEQKLHQLFAEHRINSKREFFKVAPEKVVLAISIGKFVDITPESSSVDQEDKQSIDQAKKRRSNINLSALGIYENDILIFSRDDSIEVRVTQGNNIMLNDEIFSLSAGARKVLHSLGFKAGELQGPKFWMFEGELLTERRDRMEKGQFGESN